MVGEAEPRVSPAARWLTARIIAAVPVAVIAATYFWWQPRLPDPLPTQWNRHGNVNDTTALADFAIIMVIIAVVAGTVGAAGALVSAMRWHVRRTLLVIGAAVGAFAAGLWLTIALVALDHATAATVPSPTWHVPALFVGMGVWAGLAFVACGPSPARAAATGRPGADLPRVDLSPGERVVWSEAGYPVALPYLALVPLLALAAALAVWVNVWAASPVVIAAVIALMALTIRLRIDRTGLHVGFGPWGWPRVSVPLREIESADVTTIRQSDWGGFGYRVRPGGRGIITRVGPGVRLALSEDRELVASTREPHTVAGLVNALIDQQRR